MPFTTVNGIPMHYEDKGVGSTLVLLHGFPMDGRMWAAQMEELSSRHRVIVPDFRGFGQTGCGGPFTIASLAHDLHHLLAQLMALPAAVAGLSMGGYVAMHYAANFPVDLYALILVDTQAGADTAQGRENRGRMIEVVRSKGAAAIADLMLGKLLAPATVEHRPKTVKALRQIMESTPPATIEHALVALRDRPDMTEELPKIKSPTLILVGEADVLTPVAIAEAMQSRIPGSQLTVIPGAGHMSPMEQSSRVNSEMLEFLRHCAP